MPAPSFYNVSLGGRVAGLICGIYGVSYHDHSLLFFLVAVVCGLGVDVLIMYVYAPYRQKRLFQQRLSADLVALCAKMCKAKGAVQPEDIAACNQFFDIEPNAWPLVSALFNQERKSVRGYEKVAARIARNVGSHQDQLANLMRVLYAIAHADGHIHEKERIFLLRVGDIFNLSPVLLTAIEQEMGMAGQSHHEPAHRLVPGAYKVLGVRVGAPIAEVKKAYRKLVATHHPDRLRHMNMASKDLKKAEEKMAEINAAYNTIVKN